jgi:hypothetical protein
VEPTWQVTRFMTQEIPKGVTSVPRTPLLFVVSLRDPCRNYSSTLLCVSL